MKKRAVTVLTLALSGLMCMSAFAKTEGEWINGGTKFLKADGSLARNEWIEGENGSFFYVGADGSYVTGWQTIKEKNSDATHQYYFNPADGAMYYNTYTPDGYWVNGDGVWIEERGQESSLGAAEASESGTADSAKTAAPETTATQAAETSTPEAAETTEAATETAENAGAPAEAYSEDDANRLVALINEKRRAAGKSELPIDPELQKAAEIRAKEIAAYTDDSNIYYRPQEHYMAEAAGTGNEMTNSAVTAVSEEARKHFTKGTTIVITESAAWGVNSADEAVADWFAKNENGKDKSNKTFILDTGGLGFNVIGASCYVKDGKQYYSVFIGANQS